MTPQQQNAKQALAVIRKFIIDTLGEALGTDETYDAALYAAEELSQIEASEIDDELLFRDPGVQAAFRELVSSAIGTFQMLEEAREEDAAG